MSNEKTNPDADIVFTAPSTAVIDVPQSETANIAFEKYKLKMNLLKWGLGTFGLTIITIIINWGFKDRAVGLNEIASYDRYTTELLILNPNPVKKRMLAQFFANVTPSTQLKCGWKDYYEEVKIDYDAYQKEKDSLINKRDSLEKSNPSNSVELDALNKSIKRMTASEESPYKIPKLESLDPDFNALTNYQIAIKFLLKKDESNSLNYFKLLYEKYPTHFNIDEINTKLLELSKDNMDGKDWKSLYKYIINKKLTYRIDDNLIKQLNKEAKD